MMCRASAVLRNVACAYTGSGGSIGWVFNVHVQVRVGFGSGGAVVCSPVACGGGDGRKGNHDREVVPAPIGSHP
eukprot:4032349-Pyramimonas_sp.AAC.1